MLMDVHIYLWVHSFSPSFNLQEEITQKKIICQVLFTRSFWEVVVGLLGKKAT